MATEEIHCTDNFSIPTGQRGPRGNTGTAGFIPEDVNCDGIVNVLDMIATVQQF